ncbi:hypothetical protein TA3x_002990 [Tundrisphaera sp. TA3]|uniref:hypothetical protein n=1 Tax=Tundrisphaera sp. TA3 TaxID=3435775 RepID=UPI003EBB3DD2
MTAMGRTQPVPKRSPLWDRLEARSLLSVAGARVPAEVSRWQRGAAKVQAVDAGTSAAPRVPGNLGFIRDSQFQVDGFSEVAAQWRLLTLGGPLSIDAGAAATPDPSPRFTPISNTGNIERSQYADGAFFGFGAMLEKVSIAGALAINVRDESIVRAGSTSPEGPGVGGPPGEPTNSGDIIHSQFHNGGFGNVGVQWRRVQVGGDVLASSQTFVRNPDGTPGPALLVNRPSPGVGSGNGIVRGPASVNTGLIRDSQFNDGGFGKVGLQFRGVRVRGSVGVGLERWLVQNPRTATDVSHDANPGVVREGRPINPLDATNSGRILDSQFNDGGFGDVGYQWSKVGVRGNVAASANTLSIQPRLANTGAINATNLAFGRGRPSDSVGTPPPPVAGNTGPGTGATAPPPTGVGTNDATNSGLLTRSQFNDGGFGDIGLQWRRVHVGAVGTVHNSLSVQPENAGQGRITVRDIRFPADPADLPAPTFTTRRTLPDNLPKIRRDGNPVTAPLPARTRSFVNPFAKNEATNSGDIRDSQFNDGGFGDVGLQWQDVEVKGQVRVVHNSLSIQPEGSGLAGVNVSNVAFGNPATASPGSVRARDQVLISRQATGTADTSVYLQWDRTTRRYGLLVVNNIMQVGAGTRVTFEDVRFPQSSRPATGLASGATAVNAATNSGILSREQFNDGGFGDIGMQWRNVKVAGPVTVVHNSLSVNVTGTATGPINVENVAFHSGAPIGDPSGPIPATIAPPDRAPEIVRRARNDGILAGGQFSGGGLGHIALRWRNVKIQGPVTVVDNILSVKSTDPTAGPIAIRHVSFG